VVVEVTVGKELEDPIELSDEELALVPLPKGAVAAPVVFIVAEGFVDPVGADELPNLLPDGVAVVGTLDVDVGLLDVGIVELTAAAVFANNDRRAPA
jgi:hypothetical protein